MSNNDYILLMLFFIAASSVIGVCIVWAIYKVLSDVLEELRHFRGSDETDD